MIAIIQHGKFIEVIQGKEKTMTSKICKMLNAAERDEANAVIEYADLARHIPSELDEEIKIVEGIAHDESRHAIEIKEIKDTLKCPTMSSIEIAGMMAEDLVKKVNEIENMTDNKQIHDLAEDIEHKLNEIVKIAS